jgi:hypothetical protein
MQWRYERRPHRVFFLEQVWSRWFDDLHQCLMMARDPEYSTGRVQERENPPKNEIKIERI